MLPSYIHFEGLVSPGSPAKWSYRKIGFRAPRAGEYYLSGAVVQAYKARNDLETPYMVVEPIARYAPRGSLVYTPM